jgi:hypothetical protein
MPLVTAYAMANHAPRKLKRLYDRRTELLDLLKKEHESAMAAAK